MSGDVRQKEKAEAPSAEDGSHSRRSRGGNKRALVGETVGDRYRVLDFVARGGMGTVYLAEQLGLGRKVALKILDVRPSDDAADAGEFRARFEKEASLASRVSHPNVVVVHDYGRTAQDLCYLAMEYLEGRTVQREVEENGPMRADRIVHISLQACAALGAAHAAGLIHRDLKPSNLMLTQRDEKPDFVKLVDFGLVKSVIGHEEAKEPVGVITKPGTLLGSPAFISPEQILSTAVTAASDVYSLGCVMFYMATGSAPFRGRSEYEIIRAHVEHPPPPLREVTPSCDLSVDLEAIIRRCLAKKPHDRFASADELAEAISSCDLTPRPPATPETPRPSPTPAPKAPPKSKPITSPPRRPSPGRSKTRTFASVAWIGVPLFAVAVGVGFATFSTVRPTEPEPVTPEHEPTPNPAQARPAALTPAEGGEGALRVTSEPPGAVVRYQGLDLGVTPLDLSLSPADAPWTLDFSLAGHLPRRVRVSSGAEEIDVSLARRRIRTAPTPASPARASRARRRQAARGRPERARSVAPQEDPEVPSSGRETPASESSTSQDSTAPPATSPTSERRTSTPARRGTDNLDPWRR